MISAIGAGENSSESVVRYWCASSSSYELDIAGWLADPARRAWLGIQTNANCYTTADLDEYQCLLLLGEPGIGKSYELPLIASHEQTPDLVASIDLAEYTSEGRLVRDVFESELIHEWISGHGTATLTLDSFDECQRQLPSLTPLIRRYIERWPTERLRLRLACRTSELPQALLQILRKRFSTGGPHDLGVFELLPLRRVDAASICGVEDAEAFLASVEERNAVPFAARPLTLRFLARIYEQSGTLPTSGAGLYEQGLLALAEQETNSPRRSGATNQTSPSARIAAASRIAAITHLCGRSGVWLGGVAEVDDRSVTVDACDGGTEPNGVYPVSIDRTLISETLATGIFSGAGEQRLGWAHASFADFLCARWLVANRLSATQTRGLICGGDGGIYPQMQRVAAWLVALRPDEFGWLVDIDPESFLVEIDIPADHLRVAIVDGLFDLAEREQLQYQHDRSAYKGLTHPNLHDQLVSRLTSTSESIVALAIRIAEQAGIESLVPDLISLALDQRREGWLRVAAGYAVSHLTGEAGTAALLPLLDESSADPLSAGLRPETADDLHGVALSAAWPGHMTNELVFGWIRPPRSKSYHSIYTMFLARFARALGPSDIDLAREWLRDAGAKAEDDRLGRLTNAIVLLLGQHADDERNLDVLAAYARQRMEKHEPLRVEDFESPREHILSGDVRRALALKIIEGAPQHVAYELTDILGSQGPGLVGTGDFGWAAGVYDEAVGDRQTEVGWLVQALFRVDDPTHRDIVWGATAGSAFAKLMEDWTTQVDLDSEAAQKGREYWRLASARRRRRKDEAPDHGLDERIESLAARATTGDTDAYWQALRLVTVRPNSAYYNEEFQPDLTQHPRWEQLSEQTRAHLVEFAPAYLGSVKAEPNRWLGINQTFFPARAGYRALILLLRYRPEALLSLSAEIWREWAPVVVDWFTSMNGANWDDKKRLLDLALPFAHSEIEATLVEEIAAAAAAGQRTFLAQEMRLAWSDRLSATLQSTLAADPDPNLADELVEVLIDCEPSSALPLLLSWIVPAARASNPDRATKAARQLIRTFAAESWPLISRLMKEDPEFIDQVVLDSGLAYDRPLPDLEPEQLAELYIWLCSRFPIESDPNFDEVHWVGPRELLGRWRDGLIEYLRGLGTEDGVAAIAAIAAALPATPWLRRTHAGALRILRETSWIRLEPDDVLALTQHPAARTVRTTSDLLEAVMWACREIQNRLQGDTPEAPQLWDSHSGRPKTEDEVSDYLRNRLNDFLTAQGVIVNREVQVRRVNATGVGERCDLRVDAFNSSRSHQISITVVGEVKGCWHDEVETALEAQLVGQYMADLRTAHGVYLVVWFDLESWTDDTDRRRDKATRRERSTTERVLVAKAVELADRGITVSPVMLDASRRRSEPASL